MASTRRLKEIRILADANGDVETIRVYAYLNTIDTDNPGLTYEVQDVVGESYANLTTGEQTYIDNFVTNVVSAVLTRLRPIT